MTVKYHCRPAKFARPKGTALLALLAVVLVASCGRTPSGVSESAASRHGSAAAGASSPTSSLNAGATEVILVPEREPWLLAVASPLAARLRRGSQVPYLLAVSASPAREVQSLLSHLSPRQVLALLPASRPELTEPLRSLSPEVFSVGADPAAASLMVAKRFWGTSNIVVGASAEDCEALILGSALAAHLSVPLLIGRSDDAASTFADALEELSAEQVLLATSHPASAPGARPSRSAGSLPALPYDAGGPPSPPTHLSEEEGSELPAWASGLKQRITLLGPAALKQHCVAAVGAAKIRTVVVARVPNDTEGVGGTAWLAPYISLARGGAVVLCHEPAAGETETSVARLIAQHRIRPRSITILADYDSIGTRAVKLGEAPAATAALAVDQKPAAAEPDDDEGNPPYAVEVEPCVPSDFGQVASMSVGRIPLRSLEAATALFARGLMRPGLLAGQPPRMVMVANPNLDEPLPLCEVVGRVTAAEFKNCRVAADEFYRTPASAPQIMSALTTAQLILYQGHGYHDWLFRSPASTPRQRPSQRSEQVAHSSRLPAGRPASSPSTVERSQREPREKSAKKEPHRRFDKPLEGRPVVMLQACDSLHADVLRHVYELGGVALLGSSTPIHSGSGTAFAKAFCDGLLYRGDTLGEAVRDAQNYLFCLQDLGDRRGHQEQAKMQRVALSFRLWGDPELQVFPQPLARPKRGPASISWIAPDALRITLPPKQLAEQKSDGYTAHLFPGTETAAMVKRADNGSPRELMPVHFFRLPLPPRFRAAAYVALKRPQDTSARAVFRVDPAGRFLYVLYFPQKESPQKTYFLHFSSLRPMSGEEKEKKGSGLFSAAVIATCTEGSGK